MPISEVRFMPDTCMLIPIMQEWHEHHARAVAELQRRLASGEQMFLSAHSLAECYSVVTRLPRPFRIPPRPAWEIMRGTFVNRGTLVGLAPRRYLELMDELAASGVGGGRVYDAIIAATARDANVGSVVTFNVRHFTGLVPGLGVAEPARL
jgi:predicted nucleic acid-binding protein